MGRRLTLRKRKAVAPPSVKAEVAVKTTLVNKKAAGARLWMRIDRMGRSESVEWDKNTIIGRTSIPARDLRILLSVSSHSSTILARERAMIVHLEFIRAIITAEEVLLLDPLRQEVLPFVDQLRRQLSHKNQTTINQNNEMKSPTSPIQVDQSLEEELPFEFQVLEIALQIVFAYLESSIVEIERKAYPALEDLIKYVSVKNLEQIRSLKSNITRLLGRVQKVRDEIEHLLDDDEDMSQLYLTRKWMFNQRIEALSDEPTLNHAPNYFHRHNSFKSGSFTLSDYMHVEDLEMLLEACFIQFDATHNKILSVREYIDDTEDYVKIQLDNKRNEILELQITLGIALFAITLEFLVAGMFSMNIPSTLYNMNGIFWEAVGLMTIAAVLLFFLIWGYAKSKKILGS